MSYWLNTVEVEKTLEPHHTRKLKKAFDIINILVDETNHRNRDTIELREIRDKLKFIIAENTKAKEEIEHA